MKRIVFLLIAAMTVLNCFGQGGWLKPNNSYGTIQNRISIDSTILIPTGCGTPTTLQGFNLKKSAIVYDSCAHKLYIFDPSTSTWAAAGSGGGGGGIGAVYAGFGMFKVNDSTLRADTNFVNGVVTAWRLQKTRDSLALLIAARQANVITTLGDIVYGNATPTATRLPGNTSTIKKALTQTGNGTISAVPVWDTVAVISHATDGVNYPIYSDGNGYSFHTGPPVAGGNSFYTIEFQTGMTVNAPASGDSIVSRDTLINKDVRVHVSGERYNQSTSFGYEFVKSTGTVKFHPPLSYGEPVLIEVYSSSIDTVRMPVAPLSWTDLTFTTRTGLTNTAHVWTAPGGTNWGQYGLDVLTLTGDGSVRLKYNSSADDACILGFNTSNTSQDFTNYEYGLYLADGGLIYHVDGGTPTSTGYTMTVGDYARLTRTGSTFKIQTSSDGSTWIDRYTFSATSSATHYVNLNVFDNGTVHGSCYFPQGIGLN